MTRPPEHPIEARRTAVLALHWQVNVVRPQGFFGAMLAGPVAESGVEARARDLHVGAREAGAGLVFTRFTVPDDEGALVRNTALHARRRRRPARVPPRRGRSRARPGRRLRPGDGPRQPTTSASPGWRGARCPRWLADHGVDTLLVTGVATNLTVEQTARHGTDLGFHVVVVSDCVAAADRAAHEASLAALALTCEAVLPSADVLELLRTEA